MRRSSRPAAASSASEGYSAHSDSSRAELSLADEGGGGILLQGRDPGPLSGPDVRGLVLVVEQDPACRARSSSVLLFEVLRWRASADSGPMGTPSGWGRPLRGDYRATLPQWRTRCALPLSRRRERQRSSAHYCGHTPSRALRGRRSSPANLSSGPRGGPRSSSQRTLSRMPGRSSRRDRSPNREGLRGVTFGRRSLPRKRLHCSPRGRSSVGRASASQAEGRGFEPHRPL
jgi:hypothetical protein